MRSLVMMVALGLSACTPVKPPPPPVPSGEIIPTAAIDPMTLQIEIGRWGAMVSQIEELTPQPANAPKPEAERMAMNASLRRGWDQAISARAGLCAGGWHVERTCSEGLLIPTWLTSEPYQTAPTYTELQARSDALGAFVMPLWEEVCAEQKAKHKEGSEEAMLTCPME